MSFFFLLKTITLKDYKDGYLCIKSISFVCLDTKEGQVGLISIHISTCTHGPPVLQFLGKISNAPFYKSPVTLQIYMLEILCITIFKI